jgi:hypothetical protein
VTQSPPNSGPAENLSPDDLEIVPGFTHENLHGWVPPIDNPDELRSALEKAFDYRGDVTLTRKDGVSIEGYLYDRRPGKTLSDSLVRILPANGPRVSIPYSDVAAIVFSGRDTAAGKSWEAWTRKYWEQRAQGEAAAIEPEPLD